MSTIKSSAEDLTINADGSNEIKFQINAVEKASIDSSGAFTSTTIDATALTGNLPAIDGSSLTGIEAGRKGRNIIINGAMSIAQRGTSTTSGAQVYLLDRFYTYSFAATNRTTTQSTDAPDEFSHSLKVQRTASDTATTAVYLSQPIETKQCVGTAGKKVTLSFWAKKGANWSKSGGAIGVSVYSGTGTDQSLMAGLTGATTVINTSQVLTTSWVKYSFTSAAIVATDSTQLVYQSINGWDGTAGADDSFYITGIQLETGETATDFEHRSYGEELALCQRYYENLTQTSNEFRHNGIAWSTDNINVTIPYLVEKRATPTISITSNGDVYNGAWVSATGSAVTGAGKRGCTLDIQKSSGYVVKYGYFIRGQTMTSDAEL